METPGVSISPIELISGSSEFCQTFFDDVRVPKRFLIGEPGQGWTVGKRLLQYERSSIGGVGGARQKVATLDEVAASYAGRIRGRIGDSTVRTNVLAYNMDQRAYQLTMHRAADEAANNQAPTFLSSFFKLYGTEQNMRRSDLVVSIMGSKGLGWSGDGFKPSERANTRGWLRSKANSIEGGSSEVQRNIIAKRILGLPD